MASGASRPPVLDSFSLRLTNLLGCGFELPHRVHGRPARKNAIWAALGRDTLAGEPLHTCARVFERSSDHNEMADHVVSVSRRGPPEPLEPNSAGASSPGRLELCAFDEELVGFQPRVRVEAGVE